MSAQHTPGVLSVAETYLTHDHPTRYWRTYIDASCVVAETFGATQDEAEANAQRIVQCVNAHDELVAALHRAEEWLSGWASAEPYLSDIRAAIAKATGSTQ